jgi:phenylacetate-CoA ligase
MRGILSLLRILKDQWKSPEDLEDLQLRKLRGLVRHAYHNVPFYRRLFDSRGVKPSDIKRIEDLQKLPVVTREDLQNCPDLERVAQGADLTRCVKIGTSGSTGRPLEIGTTPRDRNVFHPSFLRVYMAFGLRPWHRMAVLQGRQKLLQSASWYERFGIFRKSIVFSQISAGELINKVQALRPHLLLGYVLTLKLMAEAALQQNGSTFRIPWIASTSGTLDDSGKSLIERAFNARVIDIYASEEAGAVIAWECPTCSGYHINSDLLIVEFLRDGSPAGPGEDAQVVVTNLQNYTMPFIRYDQGDIACRSSSQPVCGRSLPLMQSVVGRAMDYLVLPNGTKLNPHHVFLVLDSTVGVGEWKIVQENLHLVKVFMSLSKGRDTGIVRQVIEGLRRIIGPDVELEVVQVDQIRREYKLRSIISKVKCAL